MINKIYIAKLSGPQIDIIQSALEFAVQDSSFDKNGNIIAESLLNIIEEKLFDEEI